MAISSRGATTSGAGRCSPTTAMVGGTTASVAATPPARSHAGRGSSLRPRRSRHRSASSATATTATRSTITRPARAPLSIAAAGHPWLASSGLVPRTDGHGIVTWPSTSMAMPAQASAIVA